MANLSVRLLPCLCNCLKKSSGILGKQKGILSTIPLTNNKLLSQNLFFARKYSQSQKTNTDESNNLSTVYHGQLTPNIWRVKIFSLSTSIFGVAAQPMIINELSNVQSVPVLVTACTVIGFFTFVNPVLLHYITKKYIIKLDYDRTKQTYLATYINFFCMKRRIEFTPDDVVVPDVPGMFTTFLAKGKPLFLDATLFDDPGHYSKIMGYDKPMDFKLFETPENDRNNKT